MKPKLLYFSILLFLFASCQKEKSNAPEENRFTKVTLAEGLNEPLELDILPNGNVLFIERGGAVKLYDQTNKTTKVVDSIAVRLGYTDANGKYVNTEEGMFGMQIDPDFEKNNFVYFYCSLIETPSVYSLLRYKFRGKKLLRESKKVMLEIPVEPKLGWRSGGSIAFDGQGNLFLSVGDDTDFGDEGEFCPIDERPNRSRYDAQRTAGNTNDLRGHILRIHPTTDVATTDVATTDGSYTIPEGNLFPKGIPKTRPEIYAMGNRNPFRISVDKKTGYLYWGNVGPDAFRDSTAFGPMGYDEINQAKKAGNFGWPYFTGGNQPYIEYDYATQKSGKPYDPKKPINNSPNNTGLTELPPLAPPFIWYPHGESKEFPLLGSGGQLTIPGPVFYSEDFKSTSKTGRDPFPDYYNGKLFFFDYIRGWIMAVTMNKNGDYESMEPFLGSQKFNSPIDMTLGKDGNLYLLQYGRGEEGSLIRIEYEAGNRKPLAEITAEKTQGAVPFTTQFSAKSSIDFDKDDLNFKWNVLSPTGISLQTFSTPDIDFTFDKAGVYQVELTVTDNKGGPSTTTTKVQAGNEPPKVELTIIHGNTSLFSTGQSFDYQVNISDKEDGSTASGSISPDAVRVTVEYLPAGFDKAMLAKDSDYSAFSVGKSLIEKNDCKSCHTLYKKAIGPAFLAVAKKYKNDPKAPQYLAQKILKGGSGVWGQAMMVAHPMPDNEVAEMVRYILSLAQQPAKSLPLKGSYTANIPKGQSDGGVFLLRATYTDKGVPIAIGRLPNISSEQVIVLRNAANIPASACDEQKYIQEYNALSPPIKWRVAQKSGAYIAYKGIELTGIGSVTVMGIAAGNWYEVGGVVEVRLGSPTGALIGTLPIAPKPMGLPLKYTTPIKPQTGKHDVYFVCRNEKAATGQDLMMLSQVQFEMGTNLISQSKQ